MKANQIFNLEVVSVRLVSDAPLMSDIKIDHPSKAVNLIGEVLSEMDREITCIINLKADGTPINCHYASMGAINMTITHPRELLKSSILSNASSMIMLHNHPSGSLFPSTEDTMITDRLLKVTEMIGIPLIDHIIVGGDNKKYYSFKEHGILQNPCITYITNSNMIEFPDTKIGHAQAITKKAR